MASETKEHQDLAVTTLASELTTITPRHDNSNESQKLLATNNPSNMLTLDPPDEDGDERKTAHPFADSDDPLLRQLPMDLVPFVQIPDAEAKYALVTDGGDRSCAQKLCVGLGCLLCGYSACRTRVVKQGQVLLTQNVGAPHVLGAGAHTILSPFTTIIGVKNVTESVIRNGPIHIISVEVGQLGYGVDMESGRPVLLTRGKHYINSDTFVWKKFIKLNEPKTELDNMQIIRVETGSIGYCFRQGKLVILQPGLHMIVPPDRFGGMMTTQMSILDLPLAVHETSDYVPLAIKSAVFYRISDPYKALVRIQNVSQQIQETCIATLAGIIRSSSLSDVASRSRPFYHKKRNKMKKDNDGNREEHDRKDEEEEDGGDDKKKEEEDGISGVYDGGDGEPDFEGTESRPFFQHVHDEFIQSLHDHVLDEWGVEIQNIRIESLKIDDSRLQSDISKQAIDVSKQHNQYIMLQKRQEIVTVEAQTRATKVRIDTNAEANRKIAVAKADADAVIIKAKADKQATELRGQGDAEYARLIQSTPLGGEIAKMRIQADSLQGLQQVAYVPHLNPILRQNNDGLFKMTASAVPKDLFDQ